MKYETVFKRSRNEMTNTHPRHYKYSDQNGAEKEKAFDFKLDFKPLVEAMRDGGVTSSFIMRIVMSQSHASIKYEGDFHHTRSMK